MASYPIGDVCVLRDANGTYWTVSICWGGAREYLARFSDQKEAGDFAVAVRNRRLSEGQRLAIHHPADCPCVCPDPEPAVIETQVKGKV